MDLLGDSLACVFLKEAGGVGVQDGLVVGERLLKSSAVRIPEGEVGCASDDEGRQAGERRHACIDFPQVGGGLDELTGTFVPGRPAPWRQVQADLKQAERTCPALGRLADAAAIRVVIELAREVTD